MNGKRHFSSDERRAKFPTSSLFDHEAAQPQSFFSSQILPAPFLIVLLATNVERANNVANSLASWLYRTRFHSAWPSLAHLPAGLGEKRAHGFEGFLLRRKRLFPSKLLFREGRE